MKNTLKFTSALTALTTLLVGCSAGSKTASTSPTTSEDFKYIYDADPTTFDYLFTFSSPNHKVTANAIDGLVETDAAGKYIGAVAESWEANADSTKWTFHLRKGVNWSTNEGEVYGEVKAQDFLTGLQHAADFDSETAYLVEGVIKNFKEYEQGKVTFDEVGIKALDDYTLEYTLEAPTPYFYTLANYSILYPVNQEFLLSKGSGCALGKPSKDDCTFGALSPDSILYNGGYIISNYTAKSKIELTKNANYWDADHVYINNVTFTYEDGSDDHAIINGFEAGNYTTGVFLGTWSNDNFKQYLDKYKDNVYLPVQDIGTYEIFFNFGRQNYNYTTPDKDKENTHAALQNVNFRRAVMFAFDKSAFVQQMAGDEAAASYMTRNQMIPSNYLTVDGKDYGETVTSLVQAAGGAFSDVSTLDGKDGYYNPTKALEFIEAAKKDGIKFPVSLDFPVFGNNREQVNQRSSFKSSVEKATNGQITINLVFINNYDEYRALFLVDSGKATDFDLSYAGWSPDYEDPKSYLNILSPVNGDMMRYLGIDPEMHGLATDVDKANAQAVGLYEYQKLLDAADKIVDNPNERYKAYAKAEAYAIENALVLTTQCWKINYEVSKLVPFTRPYAGSGISVYKYKFGVVQKDIVTKQQYDDAYKAWQAKRAEK